MLQFTDAFHSTKLDRNNNLPKRQIIIQYTYVFILRFTAQCIERLLKIEHMIESFHTISLHMHACGAQEELRLSIMYALMYGPSL